MWHSAQRGSINLPPIIDSHCHLDFPHFDDCLPQTLRRAKSIGVEHFVVPAIAAEYFPRVQALADTYPEISFALGLHPYFMQQHRPHDLEVLETTIAKVKSDDSKLCAIGELGLDFQLEVFDAEQQCFYLDAQLRLATKYQLPVILHVRKAHDQMLSLLRKLRFEQGGIVHAFNGSFQQAEQYIQLGFKLGFGGAITYPRAKKLRRLVTDLPLSAIVLETDAPDMPLHDQPTGENNQPANVYKVLQQIADLRNAAPEDIAQLTRANTLEALKLKIT